MTRLLIVRHGETDWNREGRWQGHAGPGLNELGRRQAAAIAARLVHDEVAERYPDTYREWEHGTNMGYPGGETFGQLQERCQAALDELLDRDGGRTIVLVAHGGSIRAVIGSVLGLDAGRRRLLATGRNCSLSVIESREGARRVVSVNDDGHLVPELTAMI